MLKEWILKAAGGGDGGESSSAATTKPLNRKNKKYTNTSSTGCMSVIYNLFDIQHHQFRYDHHPSFVSESAIVDQHSSFCLQGIEAPRNSLQSPESAMKTSSAPSSSEVQEQTNLNIPMGRIQIKTKRSIFTDELSSESCSSPGVKTPNLVARLMGLDHLPEYSSPRPSSSSTSMNYHRSRSLPATPRLSTASRCSMDNDYHHRLSLQVEKENSNSRRRSELSVIRQEDDRSSKYNYAKQNANVDTREIIFRRLGTDITNTMSPARSKYQRRDSNLDLLKPKKSPAIKTVIQSKSNESTQLSISSKVRLLDIKSNLNKPTSNLHSSSIKEVKLKCRTPKFHRSPVMKEVNLHVKKDEKIKRIVNEKYDLRLKKMHQQEKVFVSKKKSTALSDHVLNVNNTKKFNCIKKDMASSSSTPTRLSQKQVSLPSNRNLSCSSHVAHNLNAATTTISSGKLQSSSHSFHPSILHQLEQLRQPNVAATAAVSRQTSKIRESMGSFLAADGEVGERDNGKSMQRWLSTAFETEVNGIVVEIESEILGNLVHEIATEETMAPAW